MSKMLLVKDEADFWDDCEDLTEQEFWKKYELDVIGFEAEVGCECINTEMVYYVPIPMKYIPYQIGHKSKVDAFLVVKPKKAEVK